MSAGSSSLLVPVPTLSEAVEIAVPHMRALVAPLSAAGVEPDNLVESFIESLFFGAVWIRPPYRPIDMADAFMDDVLSGYGAADIFTEVIDGHDGRGRKASIKFEEYADFVRRTFWERPG